jgi:hypothetical protein
VIKVRVKKKRLRKAQEHTRRIAGEISEAEFFELMDEMGWFDGVSYNEDGQVSFELNNLQQIALGAAMLAYKEARRDADHN